MTATLYARARDCLLAAEAALMLTAVRVGLRILPFLTVRRLLDRHASGWVAARSSLEQVRRIVDSVDIVGRRLPWTTCLVNALAADAMLRRRGYESELCLGVRRPGTGAKVLEGHAWIEHRGTVVLGAIDDLEDYAVMSSRLSP